MPALWRGAALFRFRDGSTACQACGLDYKFADSGDGPAVFVILLAGFVVVGLALWTEIHYEPPIWLHMMLFLPMTLLVCLGLLRPMKGLMIGLQYKNRAEEGRRVD